MRPARIGLPAAMLLAIALINSYCKLPGRPGDGQNGKTPEVIIADIGSDTSSKIFRPHELIVIYKTPPTGQQSNAIKQAIEGQGLQVESVRRCNSCEGYVELWKGPGLHTAIHAEGVSGGSGGGSRGVGEDSLADYSLNFVVRLPVDSAQYLQPIPGNDGPIVIKPGKPDTVVVAVLDTGIDTASFVSGRNVWKSRDTADGRDEDENCYKDDVAGWNFINNTPDVRDNGSNRHGSLVASLIAEQFRADNVRNFIQIMTLKTHDENGYGDLFSAICAIHYAIDNGANIINASWGFYYYQTQPHPYMDSLITRIARDKGVLFVAAAGNKMDSADAFAQRVHQASAGRTLTDTELRNLAVHHFYPACLSQPGNNVLTVTTTGNGQVSATQNRSSTFTNLGVDAERILPNGQMQFRQPQLPSRFISGSSFAAAIATGKIAAYLPKEMYQPGFERDMALEQLRSMTSAAAIPDVLLTDSRLNRDVRNGQYIKRE